MAAVEEFNCSILLCVQFSKGKTPLNSMGNRINARVINNYK